MEIKVWLIARSLGRYSCYFQRVQCIKTLLSKRACDVFPIFVPRETNTAPEETFLTLLLCGPQLFEVFDRLGREGSVKGFQVSCELFVFDADPARFADPESVPGLYICTFGGWVDREYANVYTRHPFRHPFVDLTPYGKPAFGRLPTGLGKPAASFPQLHSLDDDEGHFLRFGLDSR